MDATCDSSPKKRISPIFFQTSRDPLPPHVEAMIRSRIPESWIYRHFTDEQILEFFRENPLPEFPTIVETFHSLKHGFHKADLFRYYFLYVKGGVFMDSDAMLYVPIEDVIKDATFFTVNSSAYPGTLFQGILGAPPRCSILLEALRQCCATDPKEIASTPHLWCKQLYDILHGTSHEETIRLYEEVNAGNGVYNVVDGKQVLFKHYWKTKRVPEEDDGKIRLHIPAIFYTITSNEYSHDAFTGKVKRFAPMMRSRGYDVYHYGVETSDSGATKNFNLMTKADWTALRIETLQWMEPTLSREDAIKKNDDPTLVVNVFSNWSSPLAKEFNRRFRAVLKTQYRGKRTDLVCLPLGRSYNDGIEGLNLVVVEFGIGYSGSNKDFRIFESHTWMAHELGIENRNPHNYWFVIPHAFDSREYALSLTPSKKKVGFLGRIDGVKGCRIIVEIAKRMPHVEFVLCGQGNPSSFLTQPNIVYKPPIHGTERSEYLGSCVALLAPTTYLEPFGCSMVEAQLCGTPVITSDWGGVVETVEQFKTGVRCHTIADYCYAVQKAIDGAFDRTYIRERAVAKYDMFTLAKDYDYVFQSILDVFRPEKNGWYSPDSHLVME